MKTLKKTNLSLREQTKTINDKLNSVVQVQIERNRKGIPRKKTQGQFKLKTLKKEIKVAMKQNKAVTAELAELSKYDHGKQKERDLM